MGPEYKDIRPERVQRFKDVIAKRQSDLTVVLENVHDPHNIGAVLRSCDAVGISEVFVLYTEPELIERGVSVGKMSSTGVRRWINLHVYHDIAECFEHVSSRYAQIFATHLGENAKSLYELSLIESTALVFGNEHSGVTQESLSHCHGNFIIPQHGMVQSLNISVACAVSIFEASRQRNNQQKYDHPYDDTNPQQVELLQEYIKRHRSKKGY